MRLRKTKMYATLFFVALRYAVLEKTHKGMKMWPHVVNTATA